MVNKYGFGPDNLKLILDHDATRGEVGIERAGDGVFLAALAYRDAGFHYEAERAFPAADETGGE